MIFVEFFLVAAVFFLVAFLAAVFLVPAFLVAFFFVAMIQLLGLVPIIVDRCHKHFTRHSDADA